MRMLKLTDCAQADLEQIADYTIAEWGQRQADFYLEQLYSLLDNPRLGKPRDDIKAGYRSLLVEKHLVFYRLAAEQLEIMRILHCRTDVIQYL